VRPLLWEGVPVGAEDDEVLVSFRERDAPVGARLLVGADGYFSRVRRQCLNDGLPEFSVRAGFWPGAIPGLACGGRHSP
jgi:2-polyprenyl-6-methoxyphenol hydroxylase-like FAD-dependent oxidoreductase